MNPDKTLGLRGRLTVLLLAAFLAVAGVMIWESLRDFDARLRHVSENLQTRVKMIALREQVLLARADATLDGLMLSPEVGLDADPLTCTDMMVRRNLREPEFANMVRIRPDGEIDCSGLPLSMPVNVADQAWFSQALLAPDLSVGEVVNDRILGKPVLAIGKALRDDSGSVRAVYALILDLEWLEQELAAAKLPRDARLTVVDSPGTVVTRYPDPPAWRGRSVVGHPVFRHIQAGPDEATVEERGLTGERQLVAYAPLFTSSSGVRYHVWLAIPKATVLDADYQDLQLSLAVVILVLATTLGAVFWGGDRQIVQPLEALARTAAEIGAGDLDARTGLAHGDDQVGRLARTMDETAAALQAKEAMLIDNQRQLAAAIESLRDSEERFQNVFEAAPHGMGVTNLDGRFRKCNPALCELVGYGLEELLSMRFQDIAHADDHPADAAGIQSLLQGRAEVFQTQMRYIHRQGQVLWVEMSASLVHGSDGQPAYLVRQVHDITERKQSALAEEKARLALVEAKEMAESANRSKTQFVAYMSHELRSPLNSLLIMAKLLADNQESTLTPRQVGYAQTIQEAGKEVLDLINDILDLAKLESGRTVVHAEPLAFRETLDAIEKIFRAQADNKGIKLLLSAGSELPDSLNTDTHYLLPILRNFVANAIKFTDRGSVEVKARRAREGWTPSHPVLSRAPEVVAFEVRDTGIGIAEGNLQRIFDAFEQVDRGTSHRHSGSGLGLHIALKNALLLGGEITVASVPGEGTAFTLFLPLNFAGSVPTLMAAKQAPAEPVAAADIPKVAGTVLLVDDDERNCLAQGDLLRQHGMEVLVAHNGQQAVDMVAAHPEIGVVLMDIMMPVMDGYEATLVLREKGFTDLPIIALTADARPSTRERCLAAGCSDYLSKPVDKDLLLARLERWLQMVA